MIWLTPVLQYILGALDYAEQGDADKLLTSLEEIILIVRNMITALSKMHGKSFEYNLDDQSIFSLNLCMLVNFSFFSSCLLTIFKTNFFKKLFQEHYHNKDLFFLGPDLGPN